MNYKNRVVYLTTKKILSKKIRVLELRKKWNTCFGYKRRFVFFYYFFVRKLRRSCIGVNTTEKTYNFF